MSKKKRNPSVRGYTAPQAKGYSDAGASYQRRAMRGFNAQSGSPNEDINWNNDTLRQRSRMLFMSAPLATSAIKTSRTKVVGSGLSLKCDIDREALNMTPEQTKAWSRQTEAEFRLWADRKMNCDATGINNFASLQQLVLMSWLQSGDVFARVADGSLILPEEHPDPKQAVIDHIMDYFEKQHEEIEKNGKLLD